MKDSQASLFNEQADSIPVIDKMGQAETVEYAMWHLHNSGRIDTCTAVYECYEEDNE